MNTPIGKRKMKDYEEVLDLIGKEIAKREGAGVTAPSSTPSAASSTPKAAAPASTTTRATPRTGNRRASRVTVVNPAGSTPPASTTPDPRAALKTKWANLQNEIGKVATAAQAAGAAGDVEKAEALRDRMAKLILQREALRKKVEGVPDKPSVPSSSAPSAPSRAPVPPAPPRPPAPPSRPTSVTPTPPSGNGKNGKTSKPKATAKPKTTVKPKNALGMFDDIFGPTNPNNAPWSPPGVRVNASPIWSGVTDFPEDWRGGWDIPYGDNSRTVVGGSEPGIPAGRPMVTRKSQLQQIWIDAYGKAFAQTNSVEESARRADAVIETLKAAPPKPPVPHVTDQRTVSGGNAPEIPGKGLGWEAPSNTDPRTLGLDTDPVAVQQGTRSQAQPWAQRVPAEASVRVPEVGARGVRTGWEAPEEFLKIQEAYPQTATAYSQNKAGLIKGEGDTVPFKPQRGGLEQDKPVIREWHPIESTPEEKELVEKYLADKKLVQEVKDLEVEDLVQAYKDERARQPLNRAKRKAGEVWDSLHPKTDGDKVPGWAQKMADTKLAKGAGWLGKKVVQPVGLIMDAGQIGADAINMQKAWERGPNALAAELPNIERAYMGLYPFGLLARDAGRWLSEQAGNLVYGRAENAKRREKVDRYYSAENLANAAMLTGKINPWERFLMLGWDSEDIHRELGEGQDDGWTMPIAPEDVEGMGNRFGQPVSMEGIHKGTDIQAYEGKPIHAPVTGTVVSVTYDAKGLGLKVTIEESDPGPDGKKNKHTLAHMASADVKPGDSVKAGQPVGKVGSTGGGSTGPHLDYREQDSQGNYENPERHLPPEIREMGLSPETVGDPNDPRMGQGNMMGMGQDWPLGEVPAPKGWRPPDLGPSPETLYPHGEPYGAYYQAANEWSENPSRGRINAPYDVIRDWINTENKTVPVGGAASEGVQDTGMFGLAGDLTSEDIKDIKGLRWFPEDFAKWAKMLGKVAAPAGEMLNAFQFADLLPKGLLPDPNNGWQIPLLQEPIPMTSAKGTGTGQAVGVGDAASDAREREAAWVAAGAPDYGAPTYDSDGNISGYQSVYDSTPSSEWSEGVAKAHSNYLTSPAYQDKLRQQEDVVSQALSQLKNSGQGGYVGGVYVDPNHMPGGTEYDKWAALGYPDWNAMAANGGKFVSTMDTPAGQRSWTTGGTQGGPVADSSSQSGSQNDNVVVDPTRKYEADIRYKQAMEQLALSQKEIDQNYEIAKETLQFNRDKFISDDEFRRAQQKLDEEYRRARMDLEWQQFSIGLLFQSAEAERSRQFEVAQSALKNPWLQRLTGMAPSWGTPGAPGGSSSPVGQELAQKAGWLSGTSGNGVPDLRQFKNMSPFEQGAMRTNIEMQGPGAWESWQDQARQMWGQQGFTQAPNVNPLQAASASPEKIMSMGNLANVFGETDDQFWNRQNKGWSAAAGSNMSFSA
jgi:hypothetical protein